MKISFFTRLMVFLIAIGVILTIAGYSDSMLIFKGDKLVLSESAKSDYYTSQLIEGEIFSIQGPMLTVEENRTYFGLSKKKKTNYYLIADISYDEWSKAFKTGNMEKLEKGFYVLFAVSDKDRIEECDNSVKIVTEYIEKIAAGKIDTEIPRINLHFDGKILEQRDDSNYIQGRDKWLKDSGIKPEQLANMMIYDGKVGMMPVFLFFGGIAMIIAGIVGLIIPVIKSHIQAKRDELW